MTTVNDDLEQAVEFWSQNDSGSNHSRYLMAREILRLREELQRLTDMRVRDAAYSAKREAEARWLLGREAVGLEDWVKRCDAWLAGKSEPKETP